MRRHCLHGSQFIIATHSPLLLAYPNARIYQLSKARIARSSYEATEHYHPGSRPRTEVRVGKELWTVPRVKSAASKHLGTTGPER
jgi:hypothetical protein